MVNIFLPKLAKLSDYCTLFLKPLTPYPEEQREDRAFVVRHDKVADFKKLLDM